MQILLPIRTVSEANVRGHWGGRARRARKQREAARMYVRARLSCDVVSITKGHLIVSLTRIAPRSLDTDNLVRALKAVRDGVADAMGALQEHFRKPARVKTGSPIAWVAEGRETELLKPTDKAVLELEFS